MESPAHGQLIAGTRKIIAVQVVGGVLAAAGFYLAKGSWEALSAFCGALIAVVMATCLALGVLWAARQAQQNPKVSQLILYAGAALRFLLVLVLFAIALAALRLDPLATIIGFCLAQAAYIASMVSRRPG
ncbi:MAG: ATP synthase subunit I [Gammaproteobacteria bacterium]|nr:ATP synthase subunit I [Gammaproteobacteria bacterium]